MRTAPTPAPPPRTLSPPPHPRPTPKPHPPRLRTRTPRPCSPQDPLVRHFLARSLEPVWAGLRPAAVRTLAGYYRRLHTIVPEAEFEDLDPDASADSLACRSVHGASAGSTSLGLQVPFDSCASTETGLFACALDCSFQLEGPAAALQSHPVEPLTITEDRDDTYNRAARTIQKSIRGRYFFRLIMTVVRLNREFKRGEQLALRNRMRKLTAG